MSYIGSTFSQQLTTPAVDYFNGNGVTTSFQLTRSVTSVFAIQVVVNNVPQNAREAYGITSGNQLVFTSAPSAGTNNIYVVYDSQVGQTVTPSPGTVGPSALAPNAVTASAIALGAVTTDAIAPGAVNAIDLDVGRLDGTGAMEIPVGNTSRRPTSPTVGQTRYNTELNVVEAYHASGWIALSNVFQAIGGVETTVSVGGLSYKVHTFTGSGNFTVQSGSTTVEYLIVGAGGPGGSGNTNEGGGGGGAGGLLTGSTTVFVQTYGVVVGSGGAGITDTANNGSNGGPSSAFGQTALGGGAGGSCSVASGNSGASGGGGGGCGGAKPGGAGTAGQGNAGGQGQWIVGAYPENGVNGNGGGGGGAGSAGVSGAFREPFNSSAVGSIGGAGAGVSNSITGSAVIYATGGNGAAGRSTHTGANGAANTGQGGGGGAGGALTGAGGSGVVIIRYRV